MRQLTFYLTLLTPPSNLTAHFCTALTSHFFHLNHLNPPEKRRFVVNKKKEQKRFVFPRTFVLES